MTDRPDVVVVGAGPAGLAAARRLGREPGVRTVLVTPGGVAEHLPSVIALATSDVSVDDCRSAVGIEGVEVVAGRVNAIGDGAVDVDGVELAADAVVAAPGLALSPVGAADGLVSFWDLEGAAASAEVLRSFVRGVVTIVIASTLYRCPPAPYGLAMRLARRAARDGLDIEVRLTTPEPRPVVKVGSVVTDYLVAGCARAGAEVRYGYQPDGEALVRGVVVDHGGTEIADGLRIVVPPHDTHPLLVGLAGPDRLVEVDAMGRCSRRGLYVAGDAVAAPYPKASAPAISSGIAAATGALVDLGFDVGSDVIPTPELDCFVDEGGGDYGRIHITYPDGPPPDGSPDVVIDAVTWKGPRGFEEGRRGWLSLCGAPPPV